MRELLFVLIFWYFASIIRYKEVTQSTSQGQISIRMMGPRRPVHLDDAPTHEVFG